MEQISFFKMEDTTSFTACVFTGHRELGTDFSLKKLKEEIENLIKQGVVCFYNGMALGFDLIAAETVLSLKKKYKNIKLIACIPCKNQELYFSDKDKKLYHKILKKADEVVLLSEHYYDGCMLYRNRYMVDRANVMITYCKRGKSGTAYTVNYFKRKHPSAPILFL